MHRQRHTIDIVSSGPYAHGLRFGNGVNEMDTAELTERLEKARRAVAEGDTNIQDQRAHIARLKRDGRTTSAAQLVLDALLKRQNERHQNLAHVMRQFPPG
jgi:hypothetical protein